MKRIVTATLCFFALFMACGAAQALDYVSVQAASAVLYDSPSIKGRKLYVVSRYMPLEQVVNLNEWVKVRDQSGSLAWIEKSALASKRYVVVTVELASVRRAPDQNSPIVFRVRQQVALERVDATGTGWVRVRHLDGAQGFVKVAEVWGD
jgi:SH3 domain protein